MAIESKMVAVISLNESNYPTWKVQCQMALMKERPLNPAETDNLKILATGNPVLAVIVLSVEPSLLYWVGDPEDPTVVWKKLADQF